MQASRVDALFHGLFFAVILPVVFSGWRMGRGRRYPNHKRMPSENALKQSKITMPVLQYLAPFLHGRNMKTLSLEINEISFDVLKQYFNDTDLPNFQRLIKAHGVRETMAEKHRHELEP